MAKRDFWEKSIWIWSATFITALLFSAVRAWIGEDLTIGEQWRMWILTLALALWHVVFLTYIRSRFTDGGCPFPTPVALVYLTGAIVLWFVLAYLYPDFNFVLMGLFPQVFSYIQLRMAIPIGVILAGMVTYLQLYYRQIHVADIASLSLNIPILWMLLLSVIGGVIMAFFIRGIIGQSIQRRKLIEELERTRAELAAAERREGIFQERERLAREIHDTLAQGFISIITHLEASEQNLQDMATQGHQHLIQAKETARQGLNQARRVVQDLRPEVLEKSPLPRAIERVVQGWSEQSAIRAKVAVTGTHVHLHPEAETTLIRAVQESLANVQKHAQATTARVTLSYMDDAVMLDVYDNGIGLSQASQPTDGGGYGLIAMRQRVNQVGGALTIESEPNEGTTVAVELPIQRMAQPSHQ
ncbi:MAG: sensor histidine kinase [Chloroflexota bacterium]